MNINDICKEIRNDLPSFLKSGIEWDDLYTDKESFYERAKSGESPGMLAREYFTVYNTGPYFYKGSTTNVLWNIRTRNEHEYRAVITVNPVGNNAECFEIETDWKTVADALMERVAQEQCYNQIIDEVYEIKKLNQEQFVVIDTSDGCCLCFGTKELIKDYFRARLNKKEAEDTIRFEIEPMLITAETAGRSML